MKVNLASLSKMRPVCVCGFCVSPPTWGYCLIAVRGVGLDEREDQTPSHCLARGEAGYRGSHALNKRREAEMRSNTTAQFHEIKIVSVCWG